MRLAAVVLSLCGWAFAQSVSATAVAPITCSASGGAVVQTSTQPAGPMGPLGAIGAPVWSFASANLGWSSSTSDELVQFDLLQDCTAQPGGAASVGPVDVRILLTAPQPVQATVELAKMIAATAGIATPLLRVDVGDDGTFELTESMSVNPHVNVQLGPTPLPVRIAMNMALTTAGAAASALHVYVRPGFGMGINPVLAGCAHVESFDVQPTFAGNLNMYVQT